MPLFFLAGPIAGGDDWQQKMSEMLVARVGNCIIANPCRYGPGHPQYQFRFQGNAEFEAQTLWERYYLRQAALEWPTGCIVGWCPAESKTHSRNDGNPYAMDSRGEIGEWRTHLMYDRRVRFVLGAEPEFPGLRTIKRNFADAVGPHFEIFGTMTEVECRASTFCLL